MAASGSTGRAGSRAAPQQPRASGWRRAMQHSAALAHRPAVRTAHLLREAELGKCLHELLLSRAGQHTRQPHAGRAAALARAAGPCAAWAGPITRQLQAGGHDGRRRLPHRLQGGGEGREGQGQGVMGQARRLEGPARICPRWLARAQHQRACTVHQSMETGWHPRADSKPSVLPARWPAKLRWAAPAAAACWGPAGGSQSRPAMWEAARRAPKRSCGPCAASSQPQPAAAPLPCLLHAQLLFGPSQLAQHLAPLNGQVKLNRIGLMGRNNTQGSSEARGIQGWQETSGHTAAGRAGSASHAPTRAHRGPCAGCSWLRQAGPAGSRWAAASHASHHNLSLCAGGACPPGQSAGWHLSSTPNTTKQQIQQAAHLGKVLVGGIVEREMARQARLWPPRIPLPARGQAGGGGGDEVRWVGQREPQGGGGCWSAQSSGVARGGKRAAEHCQPAARSAALCNTHSMRGCRRMSGRGMGQVGVSRHSVRSLAGAGVRNGVAEAVQELGMAWAHPPSATSWDRPPVPAPLPLTGRKSAAQRRPRQSAAQRSRRGGRRGPAAPPPPPRSAHGLNQVGADGQWPRGSRGLQAQRRKTRSALQPLSSGARAGSHHAEPIACCRRVPRARVL